MSKVIGIMGESGSGKTTAMRTLDPKSTFYIDCDGKGLSWKGWKDQYNAKNMNYWKTDIDETKCDQCGYEIVEQQRNEVESNE